MVLGEVNRLIQGDEHLSGLSVEVQECPHHRVRILKLRGAHHGCFKRIFQVQSTSSAIGQHSARDVEKATYHTTKFPTVGHVLVANFQPPSRINNPVHESLGRVDRSDRIAKFTIDFHAVAHRNKVQAAERLVFRFVASQFVNRCTVFEPAMIGIDQPSLLT